MIKIDEQISDISRVFLIFILIQVLIFWNNILIPASEKYELTKNAIYKVTAYKVPNEINLIRGEFRDSNTLVLRKYANDLPINKFDCGSIVTDPLVGKLCANFFNSKNQILTIELSERNGGDTKNLDSKILSITYLDLRRRVQKIDLWNASFSPKQYIAKAKSTFIFFTMFNFIVLIFYIFIVWRFQYDLEKKDGQKHKKYQKIYQAIKAIFLFVLFQQIFSIWYFLFSHL